MALSAPRTCSFRVSNAFLPLVSLLASIACFSLLIPPNLGRPSRQERAKEELARATRAHNGAVAALEATLAAEKSHCQDLRVRLERQTREHQVALAEADQRLLHTQEELDKVRTNEGEGRVEECSGCS